MNIKSKKSINEEDEITLEDRAPEGGYGWIITGAMILIYISTLGATLSFGLIFADFLKSSGIIGIAVAISNSLFMVTYSIASLCTNTLLKKYSTRTVGLIGVLFFSVTDILLAFIRNVYDMAILFFFQGFGLGLILTVCNTVFNEYFVKKRTKVMSAAHIIVATTGVIFPQLVEIMMTSFGYRGTTAIIGAISLNSIPAMILMHPVEWHLKKLDDVRAEKARQKVQKFKKDQELELSNRHSIIDVTHESPRSKWSSLYSLEEKNCTEVPLIEKSSAQRVVSIIGIEDGIRERAKSVSMRDSLARRMSALSASSLVNLASNVGALNDVRQQLEKKSWEKQMNKEILKEKENEKQYVEEKQEEEGFKKILRELLDISLITDWRFMNLCLGVTFVCTTDYMFVSFLPFIMSDLGYSKNDAASAITIIAAAELLSKILITLFNLRITVKPKYIFFVATVFMQFARHGFLWYQYTLMGAYVMTALVGMARSWLLVTQYLVMIEDVRVEKIASAYGILGVISGFITVIFSVGAGIIKDWTDSFNAYQVSLLVLNIVPIILWILQFSVDFRKSRNPRT